MSNAREFVVEMISQGVLQFGEFTLKSGRKSPYFLNLGAIYSGAGLHGLGEYFATRLTELDVKVEVLFGPAYKGIPLVVATAVAMAGRAIPVDVAFDRKEAKDHGEGGNLVGTPLEQKKVVLIDDVVTDGGQKRASAQLIENYQGILSAVLVAFDRQEVMPNGAKTSLQLLSEELSVPVVSVATFADVIEVLRDENAPHLETLQAYQRRYCDT